MGATFRQDKSMQPFCTDQVVLQHGLVLPIRSRLIFPHGLDGLRLWDAGIVMSRYVCRYRAQFQGRSVIELGTGVGIAGICADLFGKAEKVVLTDYQEEVLQNCRHNVRANKARRCEVRLLDWVKPVEVGQFDFVLASDVIYHGCAVAELFTVLRQCMREGGRVLLLLPGRLDYESICAHFLKGFRVSRQDLN